MSASASTHSGISQVSDAKSFTSNGPSAKVDHIESHTTRTDEGTTQPDEQRVLILCFDGTGNKFGTNSNIVRLFRSLEKDERKNQIVYYQPGIGTYNSSRIFFTNTASFMASKLDEAIALHLNDHVKEGYQFIVQNYRQGDKICLFGFSRGAHTARVVAGMVYKIGILPKENIQQVDFAFNIYNTTGYEGYKLSQEFKTTFTPVSAYKNVSVDFVGVWDTVSSVGLIPRVHPYTSVNYAVKQFRHALSLDERRARFRPNVWREITLAREHELDVDIPLDELEDDIPKPGNLRELNRDRYAYTPPERDFADVKEVWFPGTHADVGGGSHPATRSKSLSFIPLRWMIKECITSETGILFDLNYLRDHLKFDFVQLLNEIGDDPKKQSRIKQYEELKVFCDAQSQERKDDGVAKDIASNATPPKDAHQSHEPVKKWISHHVRDIVDQIFDQLVKVWYLWWLLELIPMLYTYQDHHGNWTRRRMRNFGRGRYIPVYQNKVLVHNSVKERIDKGEKKEKQNTKEVSLKDWLFNILMKYEMFVVLADRFQNRGKYKPRAYNWDNLQKRGVIEYVDQPLESPQAGALQ